MLSTLFDISIASVLAITGTLMAPLGALRVAEVLAGAMLFCLVLDVVKH